MICPNCSSDVLDGVTICPGCGYDIAPRRRMEPEQEPVRRNVLTVPVLFNALLRLLMILFSIAFFGYLFYTAYFWFDNWRTDRIYLTGDMRAPDIEEIVMDNGLKGHSLTFFGSDGDQLFIPELNRSFPFVGGLTTIDIADSSWFDYSPESDEAAIITMTPVIMTQRNGRVRLPPMDLEIETPKSPLELIEPPTDRQQVDTSMFTLMIKVVPGSKVLINGEDQSDYVDYDGMLTANLNVYPVGDNPVSISVSTAHHRQVRRDIVLYRPEQTIQLERGMNLDKSTTKSTFTVTGTTEPGASIVVDSKYVASSLEVKPNGAFSFKAELTTVGDNLITWHATMPGRQDQYATYTVYYVPPLSVYDDKTWAMDYPNLKLMIAADRWIGQAFLVRGPVVEVYEEEGAQYVVIDVAPDDAPEPQYCVLQNKSSVKSPEVGKRYRAYADASALVFYQGDNRPMLICRYMLD